MDAASARRQAAAPHADTVPLPPPEYFQLLGKRLTQLRKDHDITQAELGRVLGITQQTVFLIELGDRRVRVDWVPTLAKLFGISADDFLSISSEPPPVQTKTLHQP